MFVFNYFTTFKIIDVEYTNNKVNPFISKLIVKTINTLLLIFI